jgi:urease accessory protein
MIRTVLRFCIAVVAFVPLAASAHAGVGDTHGLLAGFSHPLTGIDHVLAMIAVGLFAGHLGSRALWLVPLTFVSVMALAASLASLPSNWRSWKSALACRLSCWAWLSRFS